MGLFASFVLVLARVISQSILARSSDPFFILHIPSYPSPHFICRRSVFRIRTAAS